MITHIYHRPLQDTALCGHNYINGESYTYADWVDVGEDPIGYNLHEKYCEACMERYPLILLAETELE